MNLGNIDWKALLNLWAVLAYLAKYNAKAGKGSKHLGRLFEDVLSKIYDFEDEDGMHDLWRRTIMKFYSRILGDRDYSLFEVMHFGLRLPGSLSSFGPVESASVSNWAPLKRGKAMTFLKPEERATWNSKIESFSRRSSYKRPRTIPDDAVANIHSIASGGCFTHKKTDSFDEGSRRSLHSMEQAGPIKRNALTHCTPIMRSELYTHTCHVTDSRAPNT